MHISLTTENKSLCADHACCLLVGNRYLLLEVVNLCLCIRSSVWISLLFKNEQSIKSIEVSLKCFTLFFHQNSIFKASQRDVWPADKRHIIAKILVEILVLLKSVRVLPLIPVWLLFQHSSGCQASEKCKLE